MAHILDIHVTLFIVIKMYIRKIVPVLFSFFLISSQFALPQDLIPGKKYFIDSDYVEYVHGNLPLIISVPHGGYEKPDDIPERTGRFAKNQDIYTIEIVYEIIQKINDLTGKYPYVIINHLHRTRLDANRNIKEAANGNLKAEKVWYAYHNRISSVKVRITEEYEKGLFIDLHGHRHKIERIELGYLLSGEELRLDKDLLDGGLLNEFSSIRHLLESNILDLSFTELIRGKYSFGSLLSAKGQVCVPGNKLLYPQPDEPFFSGGFNTSRYGSSRGGTVDGIQIEMDLHTRTDLHLQKKVADDIALSLVEFLSIHYFNQIPEIAAYGDSVLNQYLENKK